MEKLLYLARSEHHKAPDSVLRGLVVQMDNSPAFNMLSDPKNNQPYDWYEHLSEKQSRRNIMTRVTNTYQSL